MSYLSEKEIFDRLMDVVQDYAQHTRRGAREARLLINELQNHRADVHEFELDNGRASLRLPTPLTEADREKLRALIDLTWQAQACQLSDRPTSES